MITYLITWYIKNVIMIFMNFTQLLSTSSKEMQMWVMDCKIQKNQYLFYQSIKGIPPIKRK